MLANSILEIPISELNNDNSARCMWQMPVIYLLKEKYLPEDMTSIWDIIWGYCMGSKDEKGRATRGRMKSDPRRPGRDLSLLK